MSDLIEYILFNRQVSWNTYHAYRWKYLHRNCDYTGLLALKPSPQLGAIEREIETIIPCDWAASRLSWMS